MSFVGYRIDSAHALNSGANFFRGYFLVPLGEFPSSVIPSSSDYFHSSPKAIANFLFSKASVDSTEDILCSGQDSFLRLNDSFGKDGSLGLVRDYLVSGMSSVEIGNTLGYLEDLLVKENFERRLAESFVGLGIGDSPGFILPLRRFLRIV